MKLDKLRLKDGTIWDDRKEPKWAISLSTTEIGILHIYDNDLYKQLRTKKLIPEGTYIRQGIAEKFIGWHCFFDTKFLNKIKKVVNNL